MPMRTEAAHCASGSGLMERASERPSLPDERASERPSLPDERASERPSLPDGESK